MILISIARLLPVLKREAEAVRRLPINLVKFFSFLLPANSQWQLEGGSFGPRNIKSTIYINDRISFLRCAQEL